MARNFPGLGHSAEYSYYGVGWFLFYAGKRKGSPAQNGGVEFIGGRRSTGV